jgi:hypothetical protein
LKGVYFFDENMIWRTQVQPSGGLGPHSNFWIHLVFMHIMKEKCLNFAISHKEGPQSNGVPPVRFFSGPPLFFRSQGASVMKYDLQSYSLIIKTRIYRIYQSSYLPPEAIDSTKSMELKITRSIVSYSSLLCYTHWFRLSPRARSIKISIAHRYSVHHARTSAHLGI